MSIILSQEPIQGTKFNKFYLDNNFAVLVPATQTFSDGEVVNFLPRGTQSKFHTITKIKKDNE